LADSEVDAGTARVVRLQQLLAENAEQLVSLGKQHAEVVAASVDSNADDEHDPEGATIAFERQQLAAVTAQLLRTREELRAALADGAEDGRCRSCARDIGEERLAARPWARTCVDCAGRQARSGRSSPGPGREGA
jgi:RNA polymerase-binding transcription factor DksA